MCIESNQAPLSPVFPPFPPIINIEVLRGECPCSCVHCPVGIVPRHSRAAHFGAEQMSWHLFEKIACEAALYTGACLRFHATGDPILWPDLERALSLTRSLGIKSWVFTSCVTRDATVLRALSDFATIVEISINSRSRDDYAATKGIDAWDLVCSNLAALRQRLQANGAATRLILSRVESTDAEEDSEFVHFWQSSGTAADVFIRSYHSYNDLLSLPTPRPNQQIPTHRPPCLVHWGRFNISCKGKAVICFNELFKPTIPEEFILGDVLSETIDNIWRGTKLTAIRMAEQQGDYSGLPIAIPCRSCKMRQPLGGKRPTSERQLSEVLPC